MFDVFSNFYDYYYIILLLQAICAIHSIRRGTQSKWLWIIVFLPVVGSIAYIFTEIIKKRDFDNVQSNVVNIVNPTGRIKALEEQFKFSNTFANRVALADAYFAGGKLEKAVELYEQGLTGLFEDNEHVISQLIQAYYQFEQYEKILSIAPRISKAIEFPKSRACLLYALSLAKAGQTKEAETFFLKLNNRYANYEARYLYGEFLINNQRKEEAALVLHEIIEESQNLNRREKAASKEWIEKATSTWHAIMSTSN